MEQGTSELRVDWHDSNQEHLIFYGDIMGFKALVAQTPHENLHEKMVNFWDAVDRKSKPLIGPKMRIMRFSDSILIVTAAATAADLNRLTKCVTRLMQLGLNMELPIKGAISKGYVTFDENRQMVFGQSVVDAYLLEEELGYYGVAVHHSAESLVVGNIDRQPYDLIDLPMKSGMIPHYQLSWHLMNFSLEPEDITEKIMLGLDKVQAKVSCRPRLYISNTRRVIKSVNDKRAL